ncbi:G protein-activated inward rectifier potassium channel 2 [Folsomia candida]|uniref:G protein-activated inward rectifier potassium channel 2 n=1 Tax=Folsomia candida TaxID=158441 RepID=A0A226D7V5_FOLCA|nr:G protein-activated inward rectifier potassium channel 2 [Folsomia candida]OXA40944.1 G protein-activated inward rectifier potassium channel 2 [Folsomia candida]
MRKVKIATLPENGQQENLSDGSMEKVTVVIDTKRDEKNKTTSGEEINRNNTIYYDRVVKQDGSFNFRNSHVQHRHKKFMVDIFTTLLEEIRWRWTVLGFFVVYLMSFVCFGTCWYLILYMHDDPRHFGDPNWTPCITGMQNLTSAVLFSIETQQTIGYGYYHVTEECPLAGVLLFVQTVWGVILEGTVVGLVFIKMSRAKQRSETIMFSKNAVLTMRDGVMNFMFRIGDMRSTHLCEAHVRAQLIRKRRTPEGEIINYAPQELAVGGDGELGSTILLFWPTMIVHPVTCDSPLFDIVQDFHEYDEESFEIIVILEGIVPSTGNCTQARSSYLPSEILWKQQFEAISCTKSRSGERVIDYANFHKTIPSTILNKRMSIFQHSDDVKEPLRKRGSIFQQLRGITPA